MTTLPEQAHQRSMAVANLGAPVDDPYALDSSMVILPTLLIGQYQSKAFKRKLVEFGDLFVGIGSEDTAPVVVAKGGDPLGEPLVVYVHRIQQGFDTAEDPTNPKKKTLGRAGGTFSEALAKVDGDPRRVWQKFIYQLTVPQYPDYPVRFYASGMSARSARWLNTQISLLRGNSVHPLTVPFQLQARAATGNEGDYAVAEFSKADVKARDLEKHQELVQKHADLLATSTIAEEAYDAEAVEVDAAAPSLS